MTPRKSSPIRARRLPLRSLLAAALAALALAASGSSAAAASNPVEGVWSFTGGEVAIQGLSNGSYQGTVVSPTTFATCVHTAGEVMWTSMRPQADGSFWGLHQWFMGGEKCEANPMLGKTAWRVLAAADGSHQLLVCFSKPGDDEQPTIAPNGATADATYGCVTSNPVAPLPGEERVRFEDVVTLPAPAPCRHRSSLRIALRNPKHDPLRQVVVRVNGRKVATVSGPERLKKGIRLRNLPEGAFRVSIRAITVLNRQIAGAKTYDACTPGSGKIKVRSLGRIFVTD